MASYEQLFFDPGGKPLSEAVEILAEELGARFYERSSSLVLTQQIPDLEDGAFLTGEVAKYEYADDDPTDPEDRDVFDEFPYLWSAITGPRRDGQLAAEAARQAFDRIARSELRWPLVLAHDYDVLVATYDSKRGVRVFPPGTRSNALDEHFWG